MLFDRLLRRGMGENTDQRRARADVDVFVHRSIVDAPASELFRWHEHPAALLALLPTPWVRLEHRDGGIRPGERVTLSMGAGPFRIRWEALHVGFVPDRQFCDEQVAGPFAIWRHTHRVEPIAVDRCLYEDQIEFALSRHRLLNRLAAPLVRRLLARAFAARHHIVRDKLLVLRATARDDVRISA